MPSTYSSSLRIELIASGEQANQWGNTTNNNLGTIIEQGITGVATIDVTAADVTLTALDGISDQARNMGLIVTGTPGTVRTVYAPEVNKSYIVYNDSDSDVDILTTAVGGLSVTVTPSGSKLVFTDGVDFYESGLDLGEPVAGDLTNCINIPVNNAIGMLPVIHGGTGQSSYTNGQLLIGNSSTGGLSKTTLVAGPSMVITNGPGTIQLDTSGMVTSVNVSGGTTGLTTSGGPVTSAGTITLAGTLIAANGGTGLTSPGTSGNLLQSTGTGWQSAAIPVGFGNMAVLTSSTTWTAPAGIQNIRVTVVGGGGGGGGDTTAGGAGGTSSAFGVYGFGGSGGGTYYGDSGGSGGSGTGGLVVGGSDGMGGGLAYSSSKWNSGGGSVLGGFSSGATGRNYGGGGAGAAQLGPTPGSPVYPSGGGGGAGISYIAVTPGASYSIVIGSGGTAGASSAANYPRAGASGVVVIEY